jgi:hypothetical protein
VSQHIWTPGASGPLDELVARLSSMVLEFTAEHALEQAEVRLELADGSRYLLAAATAEPGFGFFSFVPHEAEGDEPRRVIIPIGAVKSIELSAPDAERPFGFASEP